MSYSSGLLNKRVTILNRAEATTSDWGKDAQGVEWERCCHVWASIDYTKGKRAMNAGALDVYAVVLVRMRWNGMVTMRSRIEHHGQMYQIIGETFHADKQANTIQFNAQIIINEK